MTLERRIVRTGSGAHEEGPLIVLLHGYDGWGDDLAPFARSLGVQGTFVFPEGPIAAAGGRGGKAWWQADRGRERAIADGLPRDLSWFDPAELPRARAMLADLLDELRRER